MIRVEAISKQFVDVQALHQVSFEVGANEVVGFLGPNGAGKTTLMRMLSGFLMPDEGSIEVAGFDSIMDSQEVKRRIGYLPEYCPLYPEMRVDEFLKYRAVIKGVLGRRIRDRLQTVKMQCGLEQVGRRIIGQLSKGYRQRIGLADALIHEPELLILDEPTVGLDPHQIRQVRSLIKELAKEHTVLISTHIMQEVDAVCERVLVIRSGEVVAANTVDGFRRDASLDRSVIIEIQCEASAFNTLIESVTWIDVVGVDVLTDDWLRLDLSLQEGYSAESVFVWAAESNLALRLLQTNESSLEEAFVAAMDGKAGS
ncbi:MAG: ABC transporter ATP-binding protein [Pontiellaceae bacterium]|nr:ABC transporter [Verrucomicrobiota bacterium]